MAGSERRPVLWNRYDHHYISRLLQHEIDKGTLACFESYAELYCKVYVLTPHANSQGSVAEERNLTCFRCTLDFVGCWRQAFDFMVKGKDEIKAHVSGQWVPVSMLLKYMITSIHDQDRTSLDQNTRWEQQRRWWRANGKVFRLLDLPFEIREIFYGFALNQVVQPYFPSGRSKTKITCNASFMHGSPIANLLQISRQVHTEASHILFRDSSFVIEHKRSLYKASCSNFPTARVTRLKLALSHMDFLQLFLLVPESSARPGFCERRELRNLEAVRGLRNLKLQDLTVQILPTGTVSPTDGLERACMKSIIDCIFRGAFEWLKGHPVRVTGWAREEQKRRFETKCARARMDYLDWCELKPLGYEVGLLMEWDEYVNQEDGGVRLDGSKSTMRADSLDIETDMSLVCRCQPRCEYVVWNAED